MDNLIRQTMHKADKGRFNAGAMFGAKRWFKDGDDDSAAKAAAEAAAAAKAAADSKKTDAAAKAAAAAKAKAAADDDADDDSSDEIDSDEDLLDKASKKGVVALPRNAFRKIKEQAKAKGEKAALAAIEDRAKKLGYKSADEMYAAAEAEAKRRAAQAARDAEEDADPEDREAAADDDDADDEAKAAAMAEAKRRAAAKGKGKDDRQVAKAIAEERKRLEEEKTKAEAMARRETRKREKLQAEKDKLEADFELRVAALKQGIVDPEYAVVLLHRHVGALEGEAAEKFDSGAFFEGLRETHPHLYGEMTKKATTGPGPGQKTGLKPGEVQKKTGANGKVDVKNMDPGEFRAHLKKLGVDPYSFPGLG